MGCTSSKQARYDRRRSPSPFFRSHSMPIHNHDPRRKAANSHHHVVALTTSTLGSLRLDPESEPISDDEVMMKTTNDDHGKDTVDKAKAWSEMIDRRIPKTPTKTPPNEPETINAWELMEGLEDAAAASNVDRSFSFNNATASPKPIWMQIGPGDSIISDFDPDIISNFQKALNELSPQHHLLLRSPEPERNENSFAYDDDTRDECDMPKFTGIVKARVSAFQEKIDAKKGKKCPPNGEKKVVFYFTSLRGVRKTYEDCWAIKVILQGYGVKVDERDVSIHGGFKDELNEILGMGFGGGKLPRIFADGKYLGGEEEVRQMHEVGELGKALEECEMVALGKGSSHCEGCGDVRFVPCETCSGSCKVFVEEEGDEQDEEVGSGFRRCPDCNENGLVWCPVCW